jgi:ribonuclease D
LAVKRLFNSDRSWQIGGLRGWGGRCCAGLTATAEDVFLFQLQQTGLPDALLAVLSDSAVVKAGVAPDFDLLSLQEVQPFQPQGFVDLAWIARHKGMKNQGLRGLAAVICGIRISKSARTTNWANRDLTRQQIQYAATDAWIGREIFQRRERLPVPTAR